MDKYNILVVDDNHINRLFFESSFKKHGFQVSAVSSGYAAVKCCQDSPFDLVLMDIRMDGMDGIQTAQKIKSLSLHLNTPIIAVSAERFDWQQYPEFCQSLLKPISQDDIQQLIHTYLNQTQVFDHQSALQISHDDEDIVLKLRTMLIEQLPKDMSEIDALRSQNDFTALDALLHKMAGSARVCAADLLLEHISAYKQHLKDPTVEKQHHQALKLAIEKTMITQ